MSEIRTFGIRHHGPGSAASLLGALTDYAPDIVLLECPADAEEALAHAANEALKPPVALLVYNPKQYTQASFFPFASFSPEWVAIRHCLAHGIHLRAFDLPLAIRFALPDAVEAVPDAETPLASVAGEPALEVDPLSHIGRIAGYDDGERWWEAELEQRAGHAGVFDAVLHLMTTLRTELARPESEETLLREAYMRETLRATIAQGYQRIAIVCGAWHSPVLQPETLKKDDKARLKSLKKVATQATWIPWTYERLSFASGYGAGVLSPAWYELLYTVPREHVVTHWMVRAAHLLREQDYDASSAHIIEGVRLAEALAAVRGLALPGIGELQEAAVTIFGGGYAERIAVIQRKLVVGEALGEVPDSLATTPLQQDLAAEQKRLKLKPEAADKRLELDLRTELHLERSHLLHRLRLLDIPWGHPIQVSGKSGTFHEHWQLRWQPELALNVVEAGFWGNTVLAAATNRTAKRAAETQSLEELSTLTEAALQADLGPAMPTIVARLETLSASTQDVTHLMGALPPLVGVMRYGNVRQTDASQVGQVVHRLVPRICISIPGACVGLDVDAAVNFLERILAVHQAVRLLQVESHQNDWSAALHNISTSSSAQGLLAGGATRLLFDSQQIDAEAAARLLGLALAPANAPDHVTAWVEGFLGNSGLLLIHNPVLFGLLDAWVSSLSDEVFLQTVPLLRRTFARFPQPERSQLLWLVTGGQAISTALTDFDMDRAQRVLPTLRMLLGLPQEQPETLAAS